MPWLNPDLCHNSNPVVPDHWGSEGGLLLFCGSHPLSGTNREVTSPPLFTRRFDVGINVNRFATKEKQKKLYGEETGILPLLLSAHLCWPVPVHLHSPERTQCPTRRAVRTHAKDMQHAHVANPSANPLRPRRLLPPGDSCVCYGPSTRKSHFNAATICIDQRLQANRSCVSE